VKNHRKVLGSCLKAAVVAVSLSSTTSFADNGMVGPGRAVAAAVALNIAPSITLPASGHAAAGVALRNFMTGTIKLAGVPSGVTVRSAYLYWHHEDNVVVGPVGDVVVFNGHRTIGLKVADNPSLCWGGSGTHTYRANVTSFINAGAPNQEYSFAGGGVTTSGQSPWQVGAPATTRKNNGAALVVLYSGGTTVGDTMIYDALGGGAMSGGAGHTFTLSHAALTGAALLTTIGADGQLPSSGETSAFNGVQYSGTPGNSDWDGSAGWPTTQLWDVTTHPVSLNGASSVITINSGSDCIAPVAFIIDKQ
jgi:hypothetical protein